MHGLMSCIEMYPKHMDYISFKDTLDLKIRRESAWPVFFGFVEHKTFVEYWNYRNCQTSNQNTFRFVDLHQSQCDLRFQRECEEKMGRRSCHCTLLKPLLSLHRLINLSHYSAGVAERG